MPRWQACELVGREAPWGDGRALARLPLGIVTALATARRCTKSGPSALLPAVAETRSSRVFREAGQPTPTRLAWFFIALTRIIYGNRACLFESVVLATALRSMGYEARIVVGHDPAPALTTDLMHAWVEIDGVAAMLTDRRNGLQFQRVLEIPGDG